MQTKVQLVSVQGMSPIPKDKSPGNGVKQMFYSHLLTFVPVAGAVGAEPAGNIHLANGAGGFQVVLAGGDEPDVNVGGTYTMTLALDKK